MLVAEFGYSLTRWYAGIPGLHVGKSLSHCSNGDCSLFIALI
jgi:hypothetical protein